MDLDPSDQSARAVEVQLRLSHAETLQILWAMQAPNRHRATAGVQCADAFDASA